MSVSNVPVVSGQHFEEECWFFWGSQVKEIESRWRGPAGRRIFARIVGGRERRSAASRHFPAVLPAPTPVDSDHARPSRIPRIR